MLFLFRIGAKACLKRLTKGKFEQAVHEGLST